MAFLLVLNGLKLKAFSKYPLWAEYRSRLRFGHFQMPYELFAPSISGMKK
jgi:hypothetical protein